MCFELHAQHALFKHSLFSCIMFTDRHAETRANTITYDGFIYFSLQCLIHLVPFTKSLGSFIF